MTRYAAPMAVVAFSAAVAALGFALLPVAEANEGDLVKVDKVHNSGSVENEGAALGLPDGKSMTIVGSTPKGMLVWIRLDDDVEDPVLGDGANDIKITADGEYCVFLAEGADAPRTPYYFEGRFKGVAEVDVPNPVPPLGIGIKGIGIGLLDFPIKIKWVGIYVNPSGKVKVDAVQEIGSAPAAEEDGFVPYYFVVDDTAGLSLSMGVPGIPSPGLGSFSLDLVYDDTVISAAAVDANYSILEATGRDFSCEDSGDVDPVSGPAHGRATLVCQSAGTAPGPSGDLPLASMAFATPGQAGDRSEVTVENLTLTDANGADLCPCPSTGHGSGVVQLVNEGPPFPCPCGPVGGITELLVGASDAPASPAEASGSSPPPYAAIAGSIAAAALALTAGAWYARRRWLS